MIVSVMDSGALRHLLVLIWLMIQPAYAHVRLTFPPARYPSLDFLESARSTPPCGVPKPPNDQGLYTELQAGSKVNVTWFQSYPHQGGFRIEILNRNDEPTWSLTPESKKFHRADIGTEWFEVQLPADLECERCAIRLLREAEEWGNYMFWTCADVVITKNFTQTCSKHGQFDGVECKCDRLFSGSQCQYKDDCWADADCGSFGVCKNQSGSPFPKRVCYCQTGYYGRHCDKVSDLKSTQFDESQYQLKTVGADKNKIFWRIWHGKEIEFVLQFPTRSWMAIGWRPKGLNKQCQLQPRHNITAATITSTIPVTKAESIASSQSPIAATIPSLVAIDTTIVPRVNNSDVGLKSNNVSGGEFPTPSVFSSGPQTTFFLETSRSQPTDLPTTNEILLNHTYPAALGTPEPFYPGLGQASFLPAHIELQPNMVHHHISVEPTGNFTHPITTATAAAESTVSASPDTTVITATKPQLIVKSHTEAEATSFTVPLQLNSNNSSITFKSTTTAFKSTKDSNIQRKTETTVEPNANGTVPAGSIPAGLKTAINVGTSEIGKTSNSPLNQQVADRLAGVPEISKVVGESCYGEWKWPPQCIDSNHPPAGRRSCDYRASWSYREETDDIEFSLQTRGPNNWWTGIGFSKTATMLDADMIIVTSESGEIKVKDMHSSSYGVPELDAKQNVKSQGGTHVNGVIRVGFTRPRATDDKDDVSFTDVDCFYMLFPTTGGRMEQGQIAKHRDVPKNSTVPICIRKCPNKQPTTKNCQSEFKYPPGCTAPDCDYRAVWKYDESKDDVSFEITSKELGRWTGIGFSKDGNMTNSDMIVGWIYDDQPYITDRFAYGKHQPAIDAVQNLDGIGGRKVNEYQTLLFRRKVDTPDTKEDLPLSECLYFLFPVGGGRVIARSASEFNDKTSSIGFHDLYIPRVTKEPVCICTDKGEPIGQKKQKRQAVSVTPDPFFFGTNNEKTTESLRTKPAPITLDPIKFPVYQGENVTVATEATDKPSEEPAITQQPQLNLNISNVFNNLGAIVSHFTGEILSNNSIDEVIKAVDNLNVTHVKDLLQTVGKLNLNTSDNGVNGKDLVKTISNLSHVQVGTESSTTEATTIAETTLITTESPQNKSELPIGDIQLNTTGSSANITAAESTVATTAETTTQLPITNATVSEGTVNATAAANIISSEPIQNTTELQASTSGPTIIPEPSSNVTEIHSTNAQEPIANATEIVSTSNEHSTASEPISSGTTVANGHQSLPEPNANETHPVSHGEPYKNEVENPMDCTDIVIATVTDGTLSRIGDFYTISRATPRPDSFYMGDDSITSAMGFERDGITTVMFRKPLQTTDPADHSFYNELMTVIWAKGQDGLYYEPNALKYHGSTNRGTFDVNFFDAPQVNGNVTKTKTVKGDMEEKTYYVHLYLPKLEWSPELEDQNSAKFNELSQKLKEDVATMLGHKLSGFKGVKDVKFTNGSVHAHMEVNVEGHTAKEIRSVLTEEFKESHPGDLGRLVIDPQSVEVQKKAVDYQIKDIILDNEIQILTGSNTNEPKLISPRLMVSTEPIKLRLNLSNHIIHDPKNLNFVTSEAVKTHGTTDLTSINTTLNQWITREQKPLIEERRVSDEALRNYIIIAVVGFLVLICVMFAACMVFRSRRNRTTKAVMTANPYAQHPAQYYYNYGHMAQTAPMAMGPQGGFNGGSKSSSDRSKKRTKVGGETSSEHSNESTKAVGVERLKPTEMQQIESAAYDPYATGVYMSQSSAVPAPGFYRPY